MADTLTEQLDFYVQAAPIGLVRVLKQFVAFPTERNNCFLSGYLAALAFTGDIGEDAATFWRNLGGAISSGLVDLTVVHGKLAA